MGSFFGLCNDDKDNYDYENNPNSNNNKNNNKKSDNDKKDNKKNHQQLYQKECLDQHNYYRKIHHVNPLELNEELSTIAQKCAEQLAVDSSNTNEYTKYKEEDLGENLYKANGKISGRDVVNTWYSENKKYNYDLDINKGTGHFTQIVWKNTKYLGVGYAITPEGYTIVCAKYLPSGNYLTKFKDNVLKP